MVALVTCFVLFPVAALTVDIGNTWARRGQLQFQVDRAVKFAAEKLPVDTTTVTSTPTTTQLAVARAAAYYMACHGVPGQDDVATIPSCPADGTDYTADAGIRTFALSLLEHGRTGLSTSLGSLTFPTVNKVKIRAPDALVSFGFARVMGVDSTTQHKSATAVVLSPGEVVPIGMSLSCMANSMGSAPLGVGDTSSTVMPVNYVSTGSGAVLATPTVTTNTYTDSQAYWGDVDQGGANPASISLASSSINSASGLVTLSFGWTSTRTGWTVLTQQVLIRKVGYVATDGTTGYYQGPTLLGTTSPTAPWSVRLPPGDYEALIYVTGTNGIQTKPWTNNPKFNVKIHVPDVGQLAHYVACARPAQSPRLGIATDADAMSVNIAQGIDHGLQAFPGLADALDNVHIGVGNGTGVASTVALLGSSGISALSCGSSSSVKKDYATRRTDGPNCIRVDTGTDWGSAVTKGLLTGGTFATGAVDGRLKCPSSGSCNYKSTRATLSAPGGIAGTYNDDHFSDFITGSYLADPFLMSLDSAISTSVPLVTPPNTSLDTALYSSPRFFWAPYLVTAYPTASAADYSVLTFRPVFLTADASSTITTPIDTLLLSLINSSVSGGLTLTQTLTAMGATPACLLLGTTACEKSLLKQTNIGATLTSYLGTSTVTTGGMVIDSTSKTVRAARLMTLAPGALPAPPTSYSGPTTDYLGVGPKIIRLTE